MTQPVITFTISSIRVGKQYHTFTVYNENMEYNQLEYNVIPKGQSW